MPEKDTYRRFEIHSSILAKVNISVSVRDMTILMAAIDPATPETPGTIANSVLFTLEVTRYWSDTAAGTLAVSRPEHLRHSPPPPSFALDCQRRNRSAGVAARENHMERSFPRSGDGSYWHERCLTVAGTESSCYVTKWSIVAPPSGS